MQYSSSSSTGTALDDTNNQWEEDSEENKKNLKIIRRLREELENLKVDYSQIKTELEVKSLLVQASTNNDLVIQMAKEEAELRKSKL
jgi:hypothetical protein